MKTDKIILLSELKEMMDIEIQRLKEINPDHHLLSGMLYAGGYVTSCTDESPEAQRLIELGEAVKLAFQCKYGEINLYNCFECETTVKNSEELLEWYKKQEGNNGKVD